jgi:RND family efflux transporter MFP subunit
MTDHPTPEKEAPAPGTTEGRPIQAPTRRGHTVRLLGIGGLAALLLFGALSAGFVPRWRQESKLDGEAAVPKVTVAVAKRVAADADRVLPGNSLPWLEASLFARTTGYVKRRLVDIGDRVTEGQLLAEISAPDIDDQLAQAKANLAQAQANLPLAEANARLAKITQARDVRSGPLAVPAEQVDQDKATAETTAAQVEATRASIQVNEAAVQRYTDLQGFQKIVAPFRGVITARNVDAGDLIAADSPSSTQELFHIMRTDLLRVWVNVPQVFATGIKVGQEAEVFRREEPQKVFKGTVDRTADALDPNTRTLLTQVRVPNPDNQLRPGMYLQVRFLFARQFLPVRIPTAALVIRTGRPRVGVLDAGQRVHYREVRLGRDYGAEVDVIDGLSAGDRVVVHPGDDIPEGTVVQPVAPPSK